MSTQAEIVTRRKRITPIYRFSLIIGATTTVLNYAPDGWNEQISLKRNKTYRGLFSTLSTNELTFHKDGYNLIKSAYNSGGVDAEILLKVERYNYGTNIYSDLVTMKVDLATYEETDIGVKVQVIDSSFQEIINNRDSVKVNLMNDVTIDGVAVTNNSGQLTIPDTNVSNSADWVTGTYYATPVPKSHIVPFSFTSESGISDAITPDTSKTGADAYMVGGIGIGRVFSFTGNVEAHITAPLGGTDAPVSLSIIMDIYDSDGTLSQTIPLGSDSGTSPYNFNISISQNVNLKSEQKIVIGGKWTGTSDFIFGYDVLSLSISETYVGTNAGIITAFPIYEAFLRTIQMITGVEDCFYSNKFGRTDTPIITYPSNGDCLHIFKGKYLRADGQTVPVTLKDLFNSINSIYNIGLGIENGKVRIEDLSYFYADTLLLDLTGRVPDEMIKRGVDPERINAAVQIGFSKYNNQLKPTGGYEFETKTDYASHIKSVTTTKYILSQYRADTTQMIAIQQETDVTKDATGDDDIFLIKTFRDGDHFTAETNQNFTFVSGTPYAEKSFNLEFTPARNMKRWANVLASGTDGVYVWQNTDVNINLQTQKTGETSPVVESADLNFSGLQRFFAEIIKFEVDLTFDEVTSILGAPYGYIVVNSTISGWIEEMELKDSKVTLKLRRRWQ